MKLALRLVLAYLVASLCMAVLAVVLRPLHAHVPVFVVLLAFPLFPVLAVRDVLAGEFRLDDLLPVGCFVLVFGGMAWRAVRRRAA